MNTVVRGLRYYDRDIDFKTALTIDRVREIIAQITTRADPTEAIANLRAIVVTRVTPGQIEDFVETLRFPLRSHQSIDITGGSECDEIVIARHFELRIHLKTVIYGKVAFEPRESVDELIPQDCAPATVVTRPRKKDKRDSLE